MSDEEKRKELYDLCSRIDWGKSNRFDDIQEWLDNNKDNENLLFQAANYIDEKYNDTPLLVLVRNEPPSNLVKIFLQLAPDTVTVQNINGWVPLHVALVSEASIDVVKILFQAYPKAVEVKKYTW